mmetsp:Transcript_21947/g.52238  ORF Transcript_21947/g.52238 Transcript_21947/m.52238 type:complete len:199 (+) Transcript_21947:166-762(+)|eukprot:CAMPEP_0197173444 /NCGR_PEP_ID=MMETSP1423-20130617/376_1 /TAXON_ID=476441 /ORGANISM="Pseudo-nitzschia heimii, Strain UNC1101" /LENGTH=198 /DNA_ID=CAMNT_0042622265 /DNA_START=70 /DNA_END=666 /DNA_ORIENTATION=-
MPSEQHLKSQKVDHITSLQEGIDGLSLSLFEALRGLRDAVAPESGNLGGMTQGNAGNDAVNSSPTENSENDFEEFCQSYQSGDPDTLAMVRKVTATPPQKREDFLRIHKKIEMEKDAELVKKMAYTVLEKSAEIDRRVALLPGMRRTQAEQIKLVEELIEQNQKTAMRLEDTYRRAEKQRRKVRAFVRDNSCQSLGIT